MSRAGILDPQRGRGWGWNLEGQVRLFCALASLGADTLHSPLGM